VAAAVAPLIDDLADEARGDLFMAITVRRTSLLTPPGSALSVDGTSTSRS